ncbi:hypothetical protein CDAR_545921 [Caerostris darwini]|uniref:Uncharacterized protein n=1 Tax=Caerostris darwini TaxID=1538125 RepID=A0AAV4X4B9_9ARAC|nr:hypothetical protein CDAR_545921 [Caerostris darwini]
MSFWRKITQTISDDTSLLTSFGSISGDPKIPNDCYSLIDHEIHKLFVEEQRENPLDDKQKLGEDETKECGSKRFWGREGKSGWSPFEEVPDFRLRHSGAS